MIWFGLYFKSRDLIWIWFGYIFNAMIWFGFDLGIFLMQWFDLDLIWNFSWFGQITTKSFQIILFFHNLFLLYNLSDLPMFEVCRHFLSTLLNNDSSVNQLIAKDNKNISMQSNPLYNKSYEQHLIYIDTYITYITFIRT